MPVNSRIQELKRDIVVRAACDLFARNGFETVTMDDIAQAAGFSKATLYVYFESKEEILFCVLASALQVLCEEMEKILGGDGDGFTMLDRVITADYHSLRQHINHLFAFVRRRKAGAIKQEWVDAIAELVARRVGLIELCLTRGMEDGTIQVEEPEHAAVVIDSMIRGICMPRLSGLGPEASRDLEILKTLIYFGISHR